MISVEAWIGAIADGNDDAAIELTSERSLDAVGGVEGFHEMDIELAEGWGAWGRSDDRTVMQVALPGMPDVALVVLHGQVSQEGPPQESWAALPVVATEDGDRVEPFLDLGDVDVTPPHGSVIEPGEEFSVVTPDGTRATFVLDDTKAMNGDELADHPPLAPGLHALTIVLANADGVVAHTFTYTVNG